MTLPLAASATHQNALKQGNPTTYVAPSLMQFAATHNGGTKVSVIVQSSGGVAGATGAVNNLGLGNGLGSIKNLNLVGGVAVTIPAAKLDKLAQTSGLIVTPDAPVHPDSLTYSKQLWPYESGNAVNWLGDAWSYSSSTPAIAVIDSGVQPRADFGARLLASVNLSSDPNNQTLDDLRGHGTFVAGIAAGGATGYAGGDQVAPIVSVKVMGADGSGSTSDIINACQWVLDHKAQYNIKVANLSLQSSISAPFFYDPLDQAVEKLWFGGVTVVAAAGNYGTAGTPSGVVYSPGDDPFVITVGAADINGTLSTSDDSIAPWSAYGHTLDGFAKPEVSAPGRYMIGPVPASSSLVGERPDHVVSNDGTYAYMQLSGTSFSAPVVSAAAAQILARHPSWTPDQVKGALMASARPLPGGVTAGGGVGEITASTAVSKTGAANPNLALERYLLNAGTTSQSFDSASWEDAVQANASWDTASWDTASWLDASWDTASWETASWDTASWLDASWNDASWLDASWVDASWEDAADGDLGSAYTLAPDEQTALTADPTLAPDPSVLPPATP